MHGRLGRLMFGIRQDLLMYGIGAAVALLVVNRLLDGSLVTKAASSIASLPVDVFVGGIDGITGGAIPDTRTREAKTACQAARDSGDDWEASFQCPAADWFRGLFDGK